MNALSQISREPATLGEGPCWHQTEQVLYWIDIYGKQLRRYNPADQSHQMWQLDQMIGTVVPREQGGVVLALENGLADFDPETGNVEHWPVWDDRPETRFNDGKCDPQGRLWVGTMDHVEESRPLGKLYRVDPDRSAHVMEEGLTISNGLAWSPDQSTMYYIDSPTKCVFAYDFAADAGEISNKRVAFKLNDEQGWPDGMTIDSEGMIWLAHWAGQRVCRWNPQTGEVIQTIATPAPHTSCCVFGGPELTDLYITSARKGLEPAALEQHPDSGHLFQLAAEVKGTPTYLFKG